MLFDIINYKTMQIKKKTLKKILNNSIIVLRYYDISPSIILSLINDYQI